MNTIENNRIVMDAVTKQRRSDWDASPVGYLARRRSNMETYDLIAIDWDNNSDEMDLADCLGDAMETWSYEGANEEGKHTYRYTINNSLMQNTVAHGIGCDLGFVCHIEFGK